MAGYRFAFGGQSNAGGHFYQWTASVPTGASAFIAEFKAQSGADSVGLQNVSWGASAADRKAVGSSSSNYWWDLEAGKPGPRLNEAISAIRNKGPIDAFLWAQGEQDSRAIGGDPNLPGSTLDRYEAATKAIFAHVRDKLGDPDLPIFIQGLGELGNGYMRKADDQVRAKQIEIAEEVGDVDVAAHTTDLPMADAAHFTAQGYVTAAQRLARYAADWFEGNPPRSEPRPANGEIRVEAEALTLSGYVREADVIKLSGGAGTATHSFASAAGAYKIVLGYKDEFDGVGKLAAKLNGGELDSWLLDAAVPAGSHYVSRERVLTEGMELRQGDTLAIEGLKGGEEYARVDYVKFIPVTAPVEPRPGVGPAPLPTDPLPTDPDPVDPVALPAATKVGTAADDRLSGTSSADVIDGKGGADYMAGGYGDDIYIVDHAGDRIEEWNSSGKGGFDTVYALTDHTLGTYVEKLVLAGAGDIDGTGGSRNNTFVAGTGKNVLTGGGGNDLFVFAKGHLQGDVITDFVGNGAASGDQLRFEGFGPGAALSNQGDIWTLTHAGGSESFQLAGVTALDKSDYLFA